jgi:hypothetical protein
MSNKADNHIDNLIPGELQVSPPLSGLEGHLRRGIPPRSM